MKSYFEFMKCADSLKLGRYLVPALLLSLLAGCLTSQNAFYEEKNIIQDSRFVGTFVSDESGLTVTISSNGVPNKNYSVQLTEGGKTSEYRATLFKLKDSLFADVIPTDEKKVFEQYQEGAPTASGLLQQLSHDGAVRSSTRLHVLFRLSLSDNEIECFGAKKADDPSNPITRDRTLKLHSNGDGVVLEEPTGTLQSIIDRYAGVNWNKLFDGEFQTDNGSSHGFKLSRKSERGSKPEKAVSH